MLGDVNIKCRFYGEDKFAKLLFILSNVDIEPVPDDWDWIIIKYQTGKKSAELIEKLMPLVKMGTFYLFDENKKEGFLKKPKTIQRWDIDGFDLIETKVKTIGKMSLMTKKYELSAKFAFGDIYIT